MVIFIKLSPSFYYFNFLFLILINIFILLGIKENYINFVYALCNFLILFVYDYFYILFLVFVYGEEDD